VANNNHSHVIHQAYQELLNRTADPGGLTTYNDHMNAGMTEAEMRQSLINSSEFHNKFPGSEGPPPPPPPPGPGVLSPLAVNGNKFANATGLVKLVGMIICCDDPSTPEDEALARGWPLVDARTLDLMQQHSLNYTDFRLGPSISRDIFGDGEGSQFVGYGISGGLYNLNDWNPNFWASVRELLRYADARGLYILCSVIDSWLLDHQLTPWTASRNIQGYEGGSLEVVKHAPSSIHEAWIRKVVRETGEFKNVFYQDGNESFKGHPSPAWVHGIRDIVADELSRMGVGRRIFGSNSGITEDVDFLVIHDRSIPPENPRKPIIVNEYGNRLTEEIWADAKNGWDLGSITYAYWRGEAPWAESMRCLEGMKRIAEGQNPTDWPADCPTLVRWQPSVHIVMNRHRQIIESGIPEELGFVFFDSTPRFSRNPNDQRGRPCNSEHSEACEGRPCEDRRGGIWTLTQGAAQMRVENPGDDGHGYQVLLGPLGPAGSAYTVKVQALPDAMDQLGLPLNVAANHSRSVTITVGERTTSAAAGALAADVEISRERRRAIPEHVKTWMKTGKWPEDM
jgi:hypothetical protein